LHHENPPPRRKNAAREEETTPMRTLSRLLARLNRTNDALPGALAVGVLLSSGVAAAQPAQPPPPQPPAAQPAPPPAQPPAAQPAPAKTADAPLIPPSETKVAAPADKDKQAPSPDVDRDAKSLAKQGSERPSGGGAEIGARPSEVFAEDWWSSARPTFELHGYFRVRAELFHNFALGRPDVVPVLWPQPPDNTYTGATSTGNTQAVPAVNLCGPAQTDPTKLQPCTNNTQAGANMRFRINPELHISDNLRVMAQIDMLDNVVLGSTPEGYYNTPGKTTAGGVSTGYNPGTRGGYAPLGAFSTTQWTPTAGINSVQNSINVKRVWGEFMTPVGMLRFGRMPSHWGLGMVANSGDGHDSDWQSTADRIMFITGIKKYDLYFAGMWDFPNEGLTSASPGQLQGQPYDLSQLDDVNQYGLVVVRRRNPELQRLELAKGQLVVNGGMYFLFRNQALANDTNNGNYGATLDQSSAGYRQGFVRRSATAYIPDLWLQVLYRKFRFEAEAAMIYGSLESTVPTGTDYANKKDTTNNGWKIRQFGLATQSEFRAIEDRLRVQFGFGWASGDPDQNTLAANPQGLVPQQTADRTFSTFAFHPDYRIDLILWRNIFTRVTGAYYFRPSVEYDFTRDKNGQKIGGGAAVIWSRASEFIQTPGHARDLGIELNGKLYFQSRDGSLNDDRDKMGGFFTSLEYGVLFPLGGLGYMPLQQSAYTNATGQKLETATAQTLRWYLGILY
jgi:uncharacterized protein (TIGR04551 family)